METISLKELNANGNLILECKKHAFIASDERRPIYYGDRGGASACFVHYYKDQYVVTQRILSVIQLQFYRFEDAQRMFAEFVDAVKD